MLKDVQELPGKQSSQVEEQVLDIKVLIKDIDLKLEELHAKMKTSFEMIRNYDLRRLAKIYCLDRPRHLLKMNESAIQCNLDAVLTQDKSQQMSMSQI